MSTLYLGTAPLAAPGPPVPWLDPTDEAIPCAD